MEIKKLIVAISLVLFFFGIMLLSYGVYYNSRLGITLQPAATSLNSSINATINRTAALLNIANRSSYLIFYPNLQKPYSYLAKAKSVAKENPGLAYSLLALAYNNTNAQIKQLNSYRYVSLYVMLILTAISAYFLYRIMFGKDKPSAQAIGMKANRAATSRSAGANRQKNTKRKNPV